MRNTNRSRTRGILWAAAGAGALFQISSCNIDNAGAISAFANPSAFADLRRELFEASPLGRLLGGIDGSLEVSFGHDDER